MNIPQTVRIYGKKLNEWNAEDERGRTIMTQVEYEYKEYDAETGQIVSAGSEDFSRDRVRSDKKDAHISVYFGEHYLSGRRRFEYIGHMSFATRDRKALTKYIKAKYSNAQDIRIETF